MFKKIYKNKKVLITGNTGFKGSWLTAWLLKLGAEVIGVSKDIPTTPSMFEILDLSSKIKHYEVDIRHFTEINRIINDEQPDFIFHLAAQAIVSTSFTEPESTISSNVMGTTNVLESLRILNHHCVVILITSDKAYDNVEQVWGYIESDRLGGKDIYSASKGAAELIIKGYYESFFKSEKSNIKLAIGRAGNVIGGGDWAKDRIVVDCMEAWSKNQSVEIRSPEATRPWQHVLEPLSGYLALGKELFTESHLHGQAFNFGPKSAKNHTVGQLLSDLSQYWNFQNLDDAFIVTDNIKFPESSLLKLNCDKALFYIDWQASLNYNKTIRFTSEWYYAFYNKEVDMFDVTNEQIDEYEKYAANYN